MAINICSLSREEAEELTNQLTVLDANIGKKIDKVIKLTGMSYQESLEYVVTDNPILWAKVYVNWEARDYQQPILYEGTHSKQLELRLGRRLGKCLPGDVEIPDSVTGEYITVEELFKRQNANIFSLDEDELKINRHTTNIIFENGIKPVYKLTTKSGREIKATGNHPFYTIKGFKELDDLNVGDHVAIAKNMQHELKIELDDRRIKTIIDEINTSNTEDKVIPNIIYKLSNESLSIFLSRLYTANGSSVFINNKEKLEINYYNSSKKICISIQRLLLRFGINSKLNSKANNIHYLIIDEENDVMRFCKNINNVYNINNTEQNIKENASLNDIYWDEIKSIEYVEDTMTYDLTVPKYHNFVANDFITHNTDSMCILILWFAYTQINKGDNGQYNILILTPYETQIDLIFTRLDQLIEGSPFLQECISRQIHHRKELKNGSIILGLTAGASSGNNGSNNTRGQAADLIVLDEVDYIGSSQITNILNIRNEAPE